MKFSCLQFCYIVFQWQITSTKIYLSLLLQGFPNSGKVVAWEGGSGGIENFIGEILLPGEGSLKRSDFDQLKSKLTWPKFPNGMRLEQKWNRDYGCSWKCCFYWVITWKLLLVELGVGRWDFLGGGSWANFRLPGE